MVRNVNVLSFDDVIQWARTTVVNSFVYDNVSDREYQAAEALLYTCNEANDTIKAGLDTNEE